MATSDPPNTFGSGGSVMRGVFSNFSVVGDEDVTDVFWVGDEVGATATEADLEHVGLGSALQQEAELVGQELRRMSEHGIPPRGHRKRWLTHPSSLPSELGAENATDRP